MSKLVTSVRSFNHSMLVALLPLLVVPPCPFTLKKANYKSPLFFPVSELLLVILLESIKITLITKQNMQPVVEQGLADQEQINAYKKIKVLDVASDFKTSLRCSVM